MVEKAQSFQQVHAAKWSALISSTALRNIEVVKWNMPTIMPFLCFPQIRNLIVAGGGGGWGGGGGGGGGGLALKL